MALWSRTPPVPLLLLVCINDTWTHPFTGFKVSYPSSLVSFSPTLKSGFHPQNQVSLLLAKHIFLGFPKCVLVMLCYVRLLPQAAVQQHTFSCGPLECHPPLPAMLSFHSCLVAPAGESEAASTSCSPLPLPALETQAQLHVLFLARM